MEKVNFDGKKFGLLENSENGEVSSETIFEYSQNGDLVTAEYSGGSIRHGRIVAEQTENGDLEMVYNCLTNDGELKAGRADASVSFQNGRVRLDLNWEWIGRDQSSGTSTYIEIDD